MSGTYIPLESISIKALTSIKATQQTITTSASQVAATPLTDRKTITVKASDSLVVDTDYIYIGEDNTVTTSTGYQLGKGDSIDLEVDGTATIWAIGSRIGLVLNILEIA
jgi:hypothetical protein